MSLKSRYALITVDTEALPKRAEDEHVKRLIWGEHPNGRAGIRELCSIIADVAAKMVFFVDACGAYSRLDEIAEVVRWLDKAGQDVQLHSHSDYLSDAFWAEHSLGHRPRFLNQYGAEKALFTIRYFSDFISGITGKPIRAFRAGSFRWNADTIRALHEVGIPLSFNNSMSALNAGQCVFSEPSNLPYLWSNGVIEVPITEHEFFPLLGKEWWTRFQFPVRACFNNPLWRIMRSFQLGREPYLVLLLHSWSLLYWDEQGRAEYRDDRRIESLRKLVRNLAKEYDIITTKEFLELYSRGKIVPSHTVDLSRAELKQKRVAKKNSKPVDTSGKVI